MGLSYMNAGYKDEAIAAFEEMHRRQPDHRDAIYNLANLYYRSDKFKESAKIFEKVRLMEPDNPAVYYNFGNKKQITCQYCGTIYLKSE